MSIDPRTTNNQLATIAAKHSSHVKPQGYPVRGFTQNERSRTIRQFLKDHIGPNYYPGISVTNARGSMCFQTDVRLPETPCAHIDMEERRACNACQTRQHAVEAVRALIAARFPDLDDRSDSRSDYFDQPVNVA
jgi:hypothetical protein